MMFPTQELCRLETDERAEIRLLVVIYRMLEEIMADQDTINAVVQQLQADDTGIAAAATAIQQEIAALQVQQPALDLTGLQAVAAQLDTHAQAVEALAPAPAQPADGSAATPQ